MTTNELMQHIIEQVGNLPWEMIMFYKDLVLLNEKEGLRVYSKNGNLITFYSHGGTVKSSEDLRNFIDEFGIRINA